MAWFKKKIDWSKFTRQEEVVPEPPPEPVIKYPYDARLRRTDKLARNQNYSVDVVMVDKGKFQLEYEGMQVAILQDIRDSIISLVDRFDTLVTSLNNQAEPDTVEPADEAPKEYTVF